MRPLAIIVLIAACFPLFGHDSYGDVETVLKELDAVIARKQEFVAAKRLQLDELRNAATMATGLEQRFNAYDALFNGFRSYSMDTAIIYARKAMEVARESHSDSLMWYARLLEAEGMKGVGEYSRALAILDSVPEPWRGRFRQKLLNRYCSIYYSLSERRSYDGGNSMLYSGLVKAYRDSLVANNSGTSASHWLNKAEYCRADGNFTGCLDALDSLEVYNNTGNTIGTGVIAYVRGSACASLGDYNHAKYHLAVAAISDLRRADMKYEALQELANILSKEGDHERAYAYITCAITDVSNSNARSRMSRIAEYLPIITQAYADKRKMENRWQTNAIIIVSMLVLCLIGLLFVLNRKNKRIVSERAALASKNDELVKLQDTLSEVNRNLEESAKVKEEYLGYLFNLCLEYIDAHENHRSSMLLKLRSGKISDIESMLAYTQGADYLQSFFKKFDTVFLAIFPDFVDKMNALMTDGYRMEPRDGELLSAELRIYALVRLGITDSTRIAGFLHYSNQTVYNYRHRVRTHAGMSRQQFVEAVMAL